MYLLKIDPILNRGVGIELAKCNVCLGSWTPILPRGLEFSSIHSYKEKQKDCPFRTAPHAHHDTHWSCLAHFVTSFFHSAGFVVSMSASTLQGGFLITQRPPTLFSQR